MKRFLSSLILLLALYTPVLADPVGQVVGTAVNDQNSTPSIWRWLGGTSINGFASFSTPSGIGSSIVPGTAAGLTSFGLLLGRDGGHTSWNHLHAANQTVPWAAGETLSVIVGAREVNGGAVYPFPTSTTNSLADGTGGLFPAMAPWGWNGTGYDRIRSISATQLTETTSQGSVFNVPLSTWRVTNTPAVATAATASKAAGGGTVRHVATVVTWCFSTGANAQTPLLIHLRDGATGAGTIIRSWTVAAPVNESKCVDLPGLAEIGTANTAMTLEFAAAGVAASQQTVTLSGFSVP